MSVLAGAMLEIPSHVLRMCLFFFKDNGPWDAREVVIFEDEPGTHFKIWDVCFLNRQLFREKVDV